MASYNHVVLIGNVTRDLELRYTPSQLAVTDVGLAVNDKRKNAKGEWVEETTFVDITVWGRTAEVANEYLKKGSQVLFEGRLKLDSWEDKEGAKKSKLKVVAERMVLLGGKPGSGGGGGGGSRGAPRYDESEYSSSSDDFSEPSAPARSGGGGGGGGGRQQPDDDIPF